RVASGVTERLAGPPSYLPPPNESSRKNRNDERDDAQDQRRPGSALHLAKPRLIVVAMFVHFRPTAPDLVRRGGPLCVRDPPLVGGHLRLVGHDVLGHLAGVLDRSKTRLLVADGGALSSDCCARPSVGRAACRF